MRTILPLCALLVSAPLWAIWREMYLSRTGRNRLLSCIPLPFRVPRRSLRRRGR